MIAFLGFHGVPGFCEEISSRKVEDVNVGNTVYVPLALVLPGQLRVDKNNIEKKVVGQQKYLNSNPDFFAKNQSSLTRNQAIPVVKVIENGQTVYRVADSHHEVLAALQLGSTNLPIKVIADFTDKGDSPFQAFQALEAAGYVDLYDRQGNRVQKIEMNWDELKEQQDNLRAYITAHVKKIVWRTGEDKTPNLEPKNVLLVKADKNPTVPLPEVEVAKNIHLENRLATLIRKIAPVFARKFQQAGIDPGISQLKKILNSIWHRSVSIEKFPDLKQQFTEVHPNWLDQFKQTRFVFDIDSDTMQQKVEAYIKEIKGKE